MLPALLLGLVAGYAPNDVCLDDLERFAISDADLRDRIKVAFQFREFAAETKLPPLSVAEAFYGVIHNELRGGRDTTDSLQGRLAALRGLRRQLGEEDYYAGRLPPTYPPKYKRAFERWLKDKKAGRKSPVNGVLKEPT